MIGGMADRFHKEVEIGANQKLELINTLIIPTGAPPIDIQHRLAVVFAQGLLEEKHILATYWSLFKSDTIYFTDFMHDILACAGSERCDTPLYNPYRQKN